MAIFTITDNNLHIERSYRYYKKSFRDVFDWARTENPVSNVWKRSFWSLEREWATHNARERTADVDLNYPQKWYARVGYAIVGTIVWPFIA